MALDNDWGRVAGKARFRRMLAADDPSVAGGAAGDQRRRGSPVRKVPAVQEVGPGGLPTSPALEASLRGLRAVLGEHHVLLRSIFSYYCAAG